MLPIALSKRMQQIVDFATPCHTLADIGTDHAFIPIYTVSHGLAKRAIAADLREGPLSNARENVQASGLARQIDLRLGNGLLVLEPGEVDVVVSAGIGGHVHAEMLRQSKAVAERVKRLVLQPMNAGHVLRRTLDELHFHIVAEAMVWEDDKLYEVLAAEPATGTDPIYNAYRTEPEYLEFTYTYGPFLLQARSEALQVRMQRDLDEKRRVYQSVTESTRETKTDKLIQLRRDMKRLEAWLAQKEEPR